MILALVFVGLAAAQEGDATAEAAGDGDAVEREMTPGFIFNASNLLLDLSEYQGGLGAKFDYGDFAVRGLFSFELESTEDAGTSDDFALTLGASVEFPFFRGRVTPYWGGFIDGTYERRSSETSGGDTTETTTFGGSVGPLLGAEVFIFDFLSAFAEYGLALRVARITDEQEISGTKSEEQTTNYGVTTELGNAGSLGIVIYLKEKPMDESVGLRGAGDEADDDAAGGGDAE
jgi:hypothetical protein